MMEHSFEKGESNGLEKLCTFETKLIHMNIGRKPTAHGLQGRGCFGGRSDICGAEIARGRGANSEARSRLHLS